MKIRVKPANDEHRIPLPDRRYVTKEGMTLELTPFVQWMLDQGDLVVMEEEKKAAGAKANPAPEAAAPPAPAPAAKEG